MITKEFVAMMARYNAWQNDHMLAAASRLEDADRRADRGLFFGSIQRTLNHLLWGDQIWLHRFAGTPLPAALSIDRSVELYDDWGEFNAQRRRFDGVIEAWARDLDPAWLKDSLSWYSGSAGREVRRPRAVLVVHFFNHQTHHRGQVHAVITRYGISTAVTDLPYMPEFD